MESNNFFVVTDGIVNVFISSDCNNFRSERKFNKDITIAELKAKLELITGGSCTSLKIEVFNDIAGGDSVKVCDLSDDHALLGSYPVDSGMRLHVIDVSGSSKVFFDENAKVEKFELSKEQYASRSDTVRSYLQRNKLGKYNEEDMRRLEAERAEAEAAELALAAAIHVGDRCEVTIVNSLPKRGQVKYVGEVHFKPGQWVGVQYDEPVGKHDGTVDGTKYFECPNKYGAFVKVANVKTGDYPEEEINFSDDEM